ncbi:hypothetical protein BH20ACI2_BH20ACI2_13160 [soil metagenome]
MKYRHSGASRLKDLALIAVVFTAAMSVYGQREYPINAIQGDKNVSPYERQIVKTTGIVTARIRNGFFVQSPDDKADADPATSEGIFVFTRTEPSGDAAVGNLVTVSGTVAEFRPAAEPHSLPITQITMQSGRDTIQVISRGNELPKPVTLSAEHFSQKVIDELERFEGMRVAVAELSVVQPTGGRVDLKNDRAVSNGVFYGVVKGLPKPFRLPGYDLYDFIFLSEKEKTEFKKAYPKLPIFTSNPHKLRVESTAQLGSQAIDVPAQTGLRNVVGVMHYAYRAYSILTDPGVRPLASNTITQVSMPSTTDSQFSIAAMNLENLFDDEDDPAIREDIVTTEAFNRRLRKISAAVRIIMNMPDVIGAVEVENLSALKRLAQKINTDAESSGKPNPKYEAYLIDGNDGRGIDVGFMVKSSKVKVIEVKQFGKDDKYKHPLSKNDIFLHDRPPLMLRGSVTGPASDQAFEFTAVVNHKKSFLGYNDPKQQDNVRLKKRLQAEFLAKFVQERQKANPQEKIILLGDFNAHQFNDGIVDVIGTIKGRPATQGEVLNPSEDLVEPDMVNLVDLIAADQRYSYHFDGNAQVLDHVLISAALRPYVHGFGYARINADFPATARNDETRPERFSDHDPGVAYFNLVPKAAAKNPAIR